jgi:hypothetical protein
MAPGVVFLNPALGLLADIEKSAEKVCTGQESNTSGAKGYGGLPSDFLYVAPSKTACAAFSKESRMKFANATKPHRKSGGAAPVQFLPGFC